MLYWDDLESGQILNTSTITISAQDIIDYARDFDPQPYHLDPAIAEQSIFGGHCASGWQVCALMMRLFVDTMTREGIPSSGSSGVESLRWFMPVFADDTLSASITITDCHLSAEHKEHGLVNCSIDVTNQNKKSVIKLDTDVLVKCKPTGTDHV